MPGSRHVAAEVVPVRPATSPAAVRRQLAVFVAVHLVVTALTFVPMLRAGRAGNGIVFVMMWGPAIAAFVASLVTRDPIPGYGWRPGAPRFLAAALLLPALVALVGYGIPWLAGVTGFTTAEVTHYRWARMLGFTLPAPFWAGVLSKFVLAMPIAIVFALGEEIGWSGFVAPKLARVLPVPAASVVLGAYWAAWHFPAFAFGLYGFGAPLAVALPGFTLVLVGCSLMRTVLVLRARSLWPGTLLHASHNVVLMSMFWEMTVHRGRAAWIVSESGVWLGVVYIGAAVVLWRMQRGRLAAAQGGAHGVA